MSTRVFFVPDPGPDSESNPHGEILPGRILELDRDESHYLLRVRRSRVSDHLEVMDGRGKIWEATLIGASGKTAVVRIEDRVVLPPAPPPTVLLLALTDSQAMVSALEGATALGVAEVAIIRCARSQSRALPPDRCARIFKSAMRQCGRPSPPKLHDPSDLATALALHRNHIGFFAWEDQRGASEPPLQIPRGHPRRLLVGPEGGLSVDEVERIKASALHPISLGPWILRTQTAALVGLTRLMHHP